MNFKKSKKGSHIDVIVSFVIFIVFITFLFVLVNPATITEKDKKQTAEYIKLKIEDKIEADIVIVNVVNTSLKGENDCVSLDEGGLEISEMTSIAKDSNGSFANTKDAIGTLQIKWTGDSGFFRVYYSKNSFNSHITESILTCQVGRIDSVRYIQEAVETNISKLISDYNSNYSLLKTELGLSKNEEFAIQFEFNNGTIIGSSPKDAKIERYAEKYQVSYFDKEANKKSGYMIIYIW